LIKGLDLIVPIGLIILEIILNIICVGTFINGVIFVLVVTSPVWFLMLFFGWPVLLAGALVLRFASIRLYLKNVVTNGVQYLLYKYEGR
jgi:hypothetical protein